MRRLLGVIASLYPSAWRQRYGDEFAALLEDVDPGAGIAWNLLGGAIAMQMKTCNYRWILAVSGMCAIAAFAAQYLLAPPRYESAGKLVSTGNVDSQHAMDSIHRFTESVTSRASLLDLINSEHLYERERSHRPAEDAIDRMRRDIGVAATSAVGSSATFVVYFRYPDAAVAERVADALISQYIEQNLADPDHITLRLVEPPTLSTAPLRSFAKLGVLALMFGLLVFGGLSLLRHRALRGV